MPTPSNTPRTLAHRAVRGLRTTGGRAATLSPAAIRTGLAALGAAGAVLLIVAEFLPLYDVVIGSLETVDETVRGGANHAYALLVVGLVALVMALGASRGSRPAAAALLALGGVALFIALAVDLPDTNQTGTLRQSALYEDAAAQAATGFYVETLAAVLVLFAGGALLLVGRPDAPRRREPRPPREPDAPREPRD